MAQTPVVPLDLNFQGRTQAIASYMIRHSSGVVLVESGPGSTLSALRAALETHGFAPPDVTHVLLTHIHLDHAGAAGWLSRQGAEIIVHPIGAPHMLNPEKLLASAARIYGDRMSSLWGEFLAVLPNRLRVVQDGEEIVVGSLHFRPVNTPGHAEHHYAYIFEDICFSGDVGGVRIPGLPYMRAPMPPPELHLERWHMSLSRLQKEKINRIAPTHFGIYTDSEWHLEELNKALISADKWLVDVMPGNPSIEELRQGFADWMHEDGRSRGISLEMEQVYELANPLGMSADGLQRYWLKVRKSQ